MPIKPTEHQLRHHKTSTRQLLIKPPILTKLPPYGNNAKYLYNENKRADNLYGTKREGLLPLTTRDTSPYKINTYKYRGR